MQALLDEGVIIAREIGNSTGVINYWSSLARVALLHGQLEQAQVHSEAILALAREYEDVAEDVAEVAVAQRAVGEIVRRRGDLDRAAAVLRESLARYFDVVEQSCVADVPGHVIEIAGSR